jgi:3-hydroxyethyl bacteriochlorophyllide a dehydrogenase
MCEAQICIAAQWKNPDLRAVAELVESGALSLDGLITPTFGINRAREAYDTAFGDPKCVKMMIDWRG